MVASAVSTSDQVIGSWRLEVGSWGSGTDDTIWFSLLALQERLGVLYAVNHKQRIKLALGMVQVKRFPGQWELTVVTIGLCFGCHSPAHHT